MAPGRIPKGNAQRRKPGIIMSPADMKAFLKAMKKKRPVPNYIQDISPDAWRRSLTRRTPKPAPRCRSYFSRKTIGRWKKYTARTFPGTRVFGIHSRTWMSQREWYLKSHNSFLEQLTANLTMPRWKKNRHMRNITRTLVSAALTAKTIHMAAWTETNGRKKIEHKKRIIRLRQIALKHARLFKPFLYCYVTNVAMSKRYSPKIRLRALKLMQDHFPHVEHRSKKLKAMLKALSDIDTHVNRGTRPSRIAGKMLRSLGADLAIETLVDKAKEEGWHKAPKALRLSLASICLKSDKMFIKVINCLLRHNIKDAQRFTLHLLVNVHFNLRANGLKASRVAKEVARFFFYEALAGVKPPTYHRIGKTLVPLYDVDSIMILLTAGMGLALLGNRKAIRPLQVVIACLGYLNAMGPPHRGIIYLRNRALSALRQLERKLEAEARKWL